MNTQTNNPQPDPVDTYSSASSLCYVGIDVSKDTLDACLVLTGSKPVYGHFLNDRAGHRKLLRWAERGASRKVAHFCLEATGAYSVAVALYLTEANQMVSVVNPFLVKHSAVASGAGNKTDRSDAFVIAEFCRKERPALWRMVDPKIRTLVALMRHRDNLKEQQQQDRNRLANPEAPDQVRASLNTMINALQDEIDRIEEAIEQHIDDDPGLKADRELLLSIPGIGKLTAAQILAELPDVSQFRSAEAAAAYAGLNPTETRSGTSIRKKTRLSKRGNVHLRAALYMPALVSRRYNPAISAFADRLAANGKSKMAIIGACMRKLIMFAYAVLKHREPFDTRRYLAIQ